MIKNRQVYRRGHKEQKVEMFISVSNKSITQQNKSIKTKTFLSLQNVYKIYAYKTNKRVFTWAMKNFNYMLMGH